MTQNKQKTKARFARLV